jgi:hypothetical protein
LTKRCCRAARVKAIQAWSAVQHRAGHTRSQYFWLIQITVESSAIHHQNFERAIYLLRSHKHEVKEKEANRKGMNGTQQ